MVQDSQNLNNRREFPRYQAENAFTLSFKSAGRTYRGQLVDISLSGALMLCPDFAAPISDLILENPDNGDQFYARVRWQSGMRFGLEFDFSGEALQFVSQCLNGNHDSIEQQLLREA